MNRNEITMEELEEISGGILCSGHNTQKNCDVTYIRSDINGKMGSPVYRMNVWLQEGNAYCGGLTGHREKNILDQAIADGNIQPLE